jgi:DNA-binding NarL/FixJ family response regulator
MLVLTGDIDASAVEKTAMDLASVGLVWDASRLAGQAAIRAVDPRSRTSLLSCARALGEAHGVDAAAPAVSRPAGAPVEPSACRLSEREREVARLVVDGQTYREIGGRLFISAKTVEHHVSRMRQRLSASSRSDLLARLRAELAEGA